MNSPPAPTDIIDGSSMRKKRRRISALDHPELASRVGDIAVHQYTTLDRIAAWDFRLGLLLPVLAFIGIWVILEWAWWVALLLAMPVFVPVVACSWWISMRVVRFHARRFLKAWPMGSPDFLKALGILEGMSEFQLKRELLHRIRNSR